MVETGSGGLAPPGRVSLDQDGKITPESVITVNAFLDSVAQRVSGKLTLGDGTNYSRAGNINGQWIEFTTPATPDTEFQVDHSLGATPTGYLVVLQNKAGTLYTSQFASWDKNRIFLKCSAASVLFSIILLSNA